MSNAGIFPIVLAILKESSDIFPRAANSVTILDGINGTNRNDKTSKRLLFLVRKGDVLFLDKGLFFLGEFLKS